MKGLPHLLLSVALTAVGGFLLIVGLVQGKTAGALFGAGLAMVAGVLSFLLQRGVIGQRPGLVIGIALCVLALGLAYFNYRSMHASIVPSGVDHRAFVEILLGGSRSIRPAICA